MDRKVKITPTKDECSFCKIHINKMKGTEDCDKCAAIYEGTLIKIENGKGIIETNKHFKEVELERIEIIK